jgi:hypothetical protein
MYSKKYQSLVKRFGIVIPYQGLNPPLKQVNLERKRERKEAKV